MDPFFKTILDKFAAAGRPGLKGLTVAEARNLAGAMSARLGKGPTNVIVQDVLIPVRHGGCSARLYSCPDPIGLMVYFHGGGWCVGSLDDFDSLTRTLAEVTRCNVLVPEYRLAPEHPFPAGLRDCMDSLIWAQENMSTMAPGGQSLIVAGDSAGGNLALSASLALRGQLNSDRLILAYPVVDCDLDGPGYQQYGKDFILTRDDMDWFLKNYTGTTDEYDPAISPLRCTDFTGLNAVTILLPELDILTHEGQELARRLEQQAIAVDVRLYPGMIHDFLRFHEFVDGARQAIDDIADIIAELRAQS